MFQFDQCNRRKSNERRLMKTVLSLITVLALVITMLPMGSVKVHAAVGDEVSSGTCGAHLTWKLTVNGENIEGITPMTLTISGTGNMDTYTNMQGGIFAPWSSYRDSITEISLPDGITSIGQSAFWKCSRLTRVSIPDSVTEIGIGAFQECGSLSSVTFGSGLKRISGVAFVLCGLRSVTIPDSVNFIGSGAFAGNGNLTGVNIGKNTSALTWGNAFYGDGYWCRSLTAIEVDPDNTAYSTEGGVLFNKNKTKLVYYPSGKQDYTYTIPDTVTEIRPYAFASAISLTSLVVPGNVKKIGACAFLNVPAYPILREGVEEIEGSTYYPTIPLFLDSPAVYTLPSSLKKIGSNAFGVFGNGTILISGEEVEFGQNPIRDLSDSVSFTGTIYAPATVECNNLNNVKSKIVYICKAPVVSQNNYTYSGNPVTHLDLSANGGYVMDPSSVNTAVDKGDYTVKLSLKADYQVNGHSVSYVWGDVSDPSTWTTASDKADKVYNWSIGEPLPTSGTVGGCTWSLSDDNKTLTISKSADGDGKLPDYQSPWNYKNTITKVIINEGVKSIGSRSFAEHTALESVTLPYGLEKIGQMAFNECTALKQAEIPGTVSTIAWLAFGGCSSLESVTINEGVEKIDATAFGSCTSLSYIAIPGTVKEIGMAAFDGCSSLGSVYIGKGVEKIHGGAFDDCSLRTVVINVKDQVDFDSSVFYTPGKTTAGFGEINFSTSTTGLKKLTSTAGKLTATAQRGDYTMPVTAAAFTVKLVDTSATAVLEKTSYERTGSQIRPAVRVEDAGKELIEGTDYCVEYDTNTEVGTGWVTVFGLGEYTGSIDLMFTITNGSGGGSTGGSGGDSTGGSSGDSTGGSTGGSTGTATGTTDTATDTTTENKKDETTAQVTENEDGSTTATTVENNPDGSVTTKEETKTADGSTTTKEETTDANGNTKLSEKTVDADGTVTTRQETRKADGTGSASSTTKDEDGNVLSTTKEKTTINSNGTVKTKATTENADGSKVENTVKTYKSGRVVEETTETDAEGNTNTTKETTRTDAEGNITKTAKTVAKDADGNVTSTVTEKETISTDENGNKNTVCETVEKDAEGKVVSTTTETIVTDAKGKSAVTTETVNADGSKVEEKFAVSTNGSVKMSSLKTAQKEVTIPDTIEVNGKARPVTTIGSNALKGNKKITSVSIGDNISTIGANAFKGDKKLANIELSDSVIKISKNAFKGISKKAVFKINAVNEREFNRIVELIKASGVSDTVTFERVTE